MPINSRSSLPLVRPMKHEFVCKSTVDMVRQPLMLELACDRRSWPSQRPARETQIPGRRSIRGVITAKSIGPLFRPSPSVFFEFRLDS